jgi:hypothetical protein
MPGETECRGVPGVHTVAGWVFVACLDLTVGGISDRGPAGLHGSAAATAASRYSTTALLCWE